MQNIYSFKNAINLIKNGISLSLLILLSVTAYSNPVDKITDQKTGYNFLTEKPCFTSGSNSKGEGFYSTGDCTYTLSANREVPSGAATGTVTVTTEAACTWTATTEAYWITLTTGLSGTGNGSVGYSYPVNTDWASRTGTIIIAGQTYTVTQLPRPITPDSYEGDTGNNTSALAWSLPAPVFNNENVSALSIDANCHNAADVDIYKINLEAGYSYTISGALYGRNNQMKNSYELTLDAKISCSTDGSTWSAWRTSTRSPLPGKVVPQGTLYLKIEPDNPGRVGTYAARIDIKKAATTSCTYTLSATSQSATLVEGTGLVNVTTTGSSCAWTATSSDLWITLTSGQSTTGTGSVTYTYKANMAVASRTGTITIAAQTYTLTQAGRPLVADSNEPNNTVENATLLTATFTQNVSTVSISANCHINADADIYKINLEAGYSYTLNGDLYDLYNQIDNSNYTLLAKISYSTDNGSTWSVWQTSLERDRSKIVPAGTLYLKIEPYQPGRYYDGNVGTYTEELVIKKAATVGCTYVLPVEEEEVTWEAKTGQQIEVSTGTSGNISCVRTATSNTDWITLTAGQNGTGTGYVVYSCTANTSNSSRTGTIAIADKTYTVIQGIQPDLYEPNNTVENATSLTATFTNDGCTLSISGTNCHSGRDIDIYQINLEAGYHYTISCDLYDIFNHPDNISYTLNADISYSTNGSTWNEWGSAQLPGRTVTEGETIYLKIQPAYQRGVGTYGARIAISRTAGCTFNLSSGSKQEPAAAGTGSVTVTASSLCNSSWTATVASTANWITLTSGHSGTTGSGEVRYSFTANTSRSLRTGTITMAGKTYTVIQPPPSLTPDIYEGSTGNNTSAQAHTLPQPVFNNENASRISISNANCHNVEDVDIYKINLEAGYIYTIGGALYDLYNQTVGSSYTLDVKSSYSTNGSTWTYWGGSQLSGKTVQAGTLYVKIESNTRGDVGTYAAGIDIKKAATAGCTYTLLPTAREATMETDNGQAGVTTGPSCIWTATSNDNWITLTSGQSATGSVNVAYTYKANMSTYPRTGTITIAGQTFTINQAGRPLTADSYEPNNTVEEVTQAGTFTPTFTENASTLSVSAASCHISSDIDIYKINLGAGYSYALSGALYDQSNQIDNSNYTLYGKVSWSTNGSDWIYWGNRQLSNKTVSGVGILYLKIEPSSSSSWYLGTYAAKIDISRTVDCNPVLSPNRVVSPEAGHGEVTVTANSSCASSSWTAATGANWITLTSGLSGTDNGTVAYSYTANTSWSSRTGTITIGGRNYTVTQRPPSLTPDSYEGTTGNNTAAQAHTFPQPAFNTENASTISISNANCHNVEDVDIYKINLEAGYSYTLSGVLCDTDNNQANNTSYTLNITGFYSTDGSDWIYWGDSQLPGKIVQAGTHYLKIQPNTRGDVGTYAAGIDIKKAATAGCTYTLLPTSREATAETDNGQAGVTTGPSCIWTATSNDNWITLTSGQSATGSVNVAYTYKANMSTYPRTGTISIAGQTFTINQAGRPLAADSYEPNNTVEEVTQAGTFTPTFTENASTLSVSAASCHISSDIDIYKINLGSGYSYAISGALYDQSNQIDNSNYTLYGKVSWSTNGSDWIYWGNRQLSNKTVSGVGILYLKIEPSSSSSWYLGTYAAKIDISRTVDCNPVLSPNSAVSSVAGHGEVTVTTSSSCASSSWTAATGANWITLTSGLSGTDNGTVAYSYTANTSWSSRTGTITIGGRNYTVTQRPPSLTPDSYEGTTGNNTAAQAYTFPQPAFNTENASTISISNANCHNVEDVDIYKINLEAGYSYTLSGVLCDTNNNQANNTSYTLNITGFYSTDGSDWIYWGNSQLPGKLVQAGTHYLKIQPNTRGDVGTYAAGIDIKKAATAGCTYTLLPTSREATAETDNGQVGVTTGPSCIWTATSNDNWITLTSGQSATGSVNVAYTYKANMSTYPRTGTITIAGQTFTINQAGRPLTADSYEPNNTVEEVTQAGTFTPTFTENASTLSVSAASCHISSDIDIYKINLGAGYSYALSGALYDQSNQIDNSNYTLYGKVSWSTNGSDWIYWGNRQLSNKTVSGVGILYLKIEPSSSSSWYLGTYAAKIDISRTVDCNPVLSPNRVVSPEAGHGEVTVTANSSCASSSWTAATGANWITLTSGLSGTDNGTVAYSYTANTSWSSRTGTITIGGRNYTVTQRPPSLTPDSYEGTTGNNTAAQAYTFPQPVFNTENASTISISEANCHNVEDVDIYKINLEAGYSYTLSGVLYDTDNNQANTSYTLNITGFYSTDGSDWIYWGDSQLPGKSVQAGTHYLKIQPNVSGNTGTYAARIDIKKAATAGCTYTLLPTGREATMETDNGEINVTTTGQSCFRTATSIENWITLTAGQSGTGSGNVAYTYKANMANYPRTGTIFIADQSFTINQAGRPLTADSYEPNNTVEESQAKAITPAFTENASTVSIAPATCHISTDIDIYKINLEAGYSYAISGALYNAYNQIDNSNYTLYGKVSWSTTGSDWINWGNRELSNKTVQGVGNLYLKIEPYSSSWDVGTYAAKIDISRTVDCNPVLSPNSAVSSVAGHGEVTVTTSSSCSSSSWTATVASDTDWITLTSGLSGTGNGTVAYSYTANTAGSARTGTITIGGKAYTVTQAPQSLSLDGYEPNNTVAQPYTYNPVFVENANTFNISPANCHTMEDVDIYKINLATGYSYRVRAILYDKYNRSGAGDLTLEGKILYSTDGSTWNNLPNRQLWGLTVPGEGSLYFKILSDSPGKVGSYAVKIDINIAGATGCTFNLSATSKQASSEAGNDQITVTTTSSCFWAAFTDYPWITLTSGRSATSSGNVAYTYQANSSTNERTGTISIAGQTFTITQAGRSLSLSADSYEPNNTVEEVGQAGTLTPAFTENASTLSISAATCHNSTDIDIYKIILEAGYSYTLSGVLYDTENNQVNNNSYTLDVKSSYSTDGTTWTFWGDRVLSSPVVQGGNLYIKIEPFYSGYTGTYGARINLNRIIDCSPVLSPNREVSSVAGNGEVTVTTSSSCASSSWTATVASDANWITLTSGQSGTANGTVAYSYTANTSWSSRTGTITIGGRNYTVTQRPPSLTPDSYEGTTGNNTAAQAHTFPQPVFNTENASTISISEANCHNVEDVDIYKINLEAGYSYTLSGVLYDTDNNQANNTNYTLDIRGFYSTNGSDWIDWGDSQLPGKSVQAGTHYLKIQPNTRGNTGTYAARIDIIKTATVGCAYTLLPVNIGPTAEEGNGEVGVTTGSSCTWASVLNANWITLTSAQSGTGTGSVAYSYMANMSTFQRTGTITIAGQTFTITQAGRPLVSDNYEPNNTVEESQAKSITPAFTENASSVSISPATCHISTDIDIYKINLEAGYSYTLSGALYDSQYNGDNHTNYTLEVKSYYSTDGSTWVLWGDKQLPSQTLQEGSLFYLKIQPFFSEGTGTYAAKIDINRTVDCRPVLPLTNKVVSSEAGNGLITVTASPSCASPSSWTAASDADWLTLTSGQSGTGNGTVAYSYTANTTVSSRTGTITIAGKTYTVTQTPRPLSPDGYEPNNTVAQPYNYNPVFVENANTFNISPANCHDIDDVDIYKINLGTGYSYRVRAILYDRYNQTEGSAHNLYGKILYSTDGSTWNNLPYRRLWGLTAQGEGSIYFKILPYSQGELGSYAAKIDINIAGTTGCTFNLSDTGKEVSSEAGSGQVTVTTTSSCFRAAFTDYPWITLTSGQSATGSGSVAYTYAANMATEERTGTISITGQNYTITQAGRPLIADSYEPNNTVAEITQASTFTPTFTGNKGTLSISPATCHNNNDIDIYKINLQAGYSNIVSTVLSDQSTLINNNNYTLNARISYSTDGSTWSEEYSQLPNLTRQGGTLYLKIVPYYYGTRTGFYAVKIDIELTEGCTFKLPATSKEVTADAGTGKIEVTMTGGSSCAWTATSNADWITIKSGQSGTGSGSTEYAYTENKTAASRSGTITVAGQTFTVTQSIVTGIETTGSVKIFPNPAKDFVTIDFSETHIKYASVKIANQLGQILYAQDNPGQTMQIPLKGLTNGVYFIILQGEEKTWVQKLVVK